jgi:hypothetical protein
MKLPRYLVECDINHEPYFLEVGAAWADRKRIYKDEKVVFASEVEALENRVIELERQLKEGNEDGSRCNRRCEGVMVLGQPADCSCHINAPCGPCENMRPECSMCGEVVE